MGRQAPEPDGGWADGRLRRVETSAAPVREQVLKSIRGAIVQGWFSPGQRLIEREICELTGVSRTSVREALRQLESEGLVEMVPNRGPIVARITAEDAVQLYQVREVLEGLAGRLCAIDASDEQVGALVHAVDAFEQAIDAGDMADLLLLKDQFYTTLFTAAGNAEVDRMLTGLHGRITVLRNRTLRHSGRPRQTLAELRKIVDAVAARDPDGAASACAAHVARAARIALGSLGEEAADEGEAAPA